MNQFRFETAPFTLTGTGSSLLRNAKSERISLDTLLGLSQPSRRSSKRPSSSRPIAGAFYILDLAAPFSRSDLEGAAFTLTIGSDDWWKPDYFAVFGVETVNFGPRALIPFVAASAFELRQMSSDPSEGWHSVVLPTAKVLPQRPIRPDVDIDDLEGVLTRGFLVSYPEDQKPLREGRAAREANSES